MSEDVFTIKMEDIVSVRERERQTGTQVQRVKVRRFGPVIRELLNWNHGVEPDGEPRRTPRGCVNMVR